MRILLLQSGLSGEEVAEVRRSAEQSAHLIEVGSLAAPAQWEPLLAKTDWILMVAPAQANGAAQEAFRLATGQGIPVEVLRSYDLARLRALLATLHDREELKRRSARVRRSG